MNWIGKQMAALSICAQCFLPISCPHLWKIVGLCMSSLLRLHIVYTNISGAAICHLRICRHTAIFAQAVHAWDLCVQLIACAVCVSLFLEFSVEKCKVPAIQPISFIVAVHFKWAKKQIGTAAATTAVAHKKNLHIISVLTCANWNRFYTTRHRSVQLCAFPLSCALEHTALNVWPAKSNVWKGSGNRRDVCYLRQRRSSTRMSSDCCECNLSALLEPHTASLQYNRRISWMCAVAVFILPGHWSAPPGRRSDGVCS